MGMEEGFYIAALCSAPGLGSRTVGALLSRFGDAERAWRADAEGLRRLKVRLVEAGCEEDVRLVTVSADRYLAVQTESRARAYSISSMSVVTSSRNQRSCDTTMTVPG